MNSAFLNGLRARRGLPVLFGLFIFVGLLSALELALRSGWIQFLPEKYLLIDPWDEVTHISQLLAHSAGGEIKKKTIYFIGGSGARESILDPKAIESQIESQIGEPVSLLDLSRSTETQAEEIAIADNLTKSSLLIVGVSPQKFARSPELFRARVVNSPLLIDSPSLKRFLDYAEFRVPLPLLHLPVFFSYTKRYLSAHWKDLKRFRLPETKFATHYFERGYGLSLKEKELVFFSAEKEEISNFENNVFFNEEALRYTLRAAKKRSSQVVLLELPMAPVLIQQPSVQKVLDLYKSEMHLVSEEFHVPYWDFVWKLPFDETDFVDLHHLKGTGEVKFQPALIEEIANYLKSDESRRL